MALLKAVIPLSSIMWVAQLLKIFGAIGIVMRCKRLHWLSRTTLNNLDKSVPANVARGLLGTTMLFVVCRSH